MPMMLTGLAMSSWETIFRRGLLMARGACPPAEYQRMIAEKVAATQQAMLAAARGGSHAAILAPFLKRTRANARRLRRK